MKILVEFQPYSQMRYPTIGDWQFTNLSVGEELLSVTVADMGVQEANWLVAIHEIIEALLAKHNGISDTEVDLFDMTYERNRKPGDESEPGDDPDCPVYHEHQVATAVEHMLCIHFHMDWTQYDTLVNKTMEEQDDDEGRGRIADQKANQLGPKQGEGGPQGAAEASGKGTA